MRVESRFSFFFWIGGVAIGYPTHHCLSLSRVIDIDNYTALLDPYLCAMCMLEATGTALVLVLDHTRVRAFIYGGWCLFIQ